MKIDALIGKLRSSPPPAVLVLSGDEPWFIDQAIRAVRAGFLVSEDDGFLDVEGPKSIHDTGGVPLGHVLDEVRTVPMFGGRKVVVYRMGSLGGEAAAEIASLARADPPFARLIVVAGNVDRKAGKALSGVERGLSRKLFDTPWAGKPEWDTALNKWTTAQARIRDMRMSLQTAHILTEIIGNELGAIEAALRKLAVNATGREVTEDEISALVGGGRGFSAFAFGDAVYSGNAAEALRVARHAFREGMEDRGGNKSRNPHMVAARLLWSVSFKLTAVYGACRLLAEGRRPAEVVTALGGKPMVAKTVSMATRYEVPALKRHFVLLAKAEEDLRSVIPKPVLLESLVLELAGVGDE